MNLKDKISLDKVFEKEYKKKHVELENNKEAVITHFLHNSKNGVSQFFKKDAIKYTKEILQYEWILIKNSFLITFTTTISSKKNRDEIDMEYENVIDILKQIK